jgi:hypothetical protein
LALILQSVSFNQIKQLTATTQRAQRNLFQASNWLCVLRIFAMKPVFMDKHDASTNFPAEHHFTMR